MLLLTSLTIKDAFYTKFDGILGDLECSVWNGEMFLWAGLVTSTWNLVCLTVERYSEDSTAYSLRRLSGGTSGRTLRNPLRPKFFIFMRFSGKIGQVDTCLRGWRSPLGNSGFATGSCSLNSLIYIFHK